MREDEQVPNMQGCLILGDYRAGKSAGGFRRNDEQRGLVAVGWLPIRDVFSDVWALVDSQGQF
ncbi:hypothetical protein [Nocardia sp. NPDC055049]